MLFICSGTLDDEIGTEPKDMRQEALYTFRCADDVVIGAERALEPFCKNPLFVADEDQRLGQSDTPRGYRSRPGSNGTDRYKWQ